jgi:FlgD Ig-like domain
MRTKAALILAALSITCLAAAAHAVQYPNLTNPDTLTVAHIQNPALSPHPVNPDTVNGVGGIVTGFDIFPTGYAVYIQTSTGGPWTGIDLFTGGNSKKTAPGFTGGLAIGDSVVSYGKVQDFQGETELEGLDAFQTTDDILIRKVSSGNPLPPFFSGTVNQLQELPTNPNAEQWEGCLVRVTAPLRTVRNNNSGGNLGFRWAIVVDNVACPPGSVGTCDSLFLDLSTLPLFAVDPPAIGAVLTQAQGIYNQRTRGFRIQVRDCGDLSGGSTPPGLADAFPITDTKIRLAFGCPCTQASIENEANYSLGSFGSILNATQVSPNEVDLDIDNGLAVGALESVTAVNLVSSSTGGVLTTPQSRNFVNGILSIEMLQEPNPDSLGVCKDRSKFAGLGATAGTRLTARGVVTSAINNLFYVSDVGGGLRRGAALFAPIAPVVPGRQYLYGGAIQEFGDETEIVSSVFVQDLGPAAVPAPLLTTVAQLADVSCDATQSVVNGEDFEGVLVSLPYVEVQDRETTPGTNLVRFFDVINLNAGAGADSAAVTDDVLRSPDPNINDTVSLFGPVGFFSARYRIRPRGSADVINHGNNVGVPPSTPSRVSFSTYPVPARTSTVAFGLPKAGHVDLAVFDVAGRRITTIEKGRLDAGNYTREWSGRNSDGSKVGAGVYFIRLMLDGENEYALRTVRIE